MESENLVILVLVLLSIEMMGSQYLDESSLTRCINPADGDNNSADQNISLQEDISAAQNLTVLQHSHAYNITIPSASTLKRNCSGNVTDIELCYQINNTAISESKPLALSLISDGGTATILLSSCVDQPGDSSGDSDSSETTSSRGRERRKRSWFRRTVSRIVCFRCWWFCSCGDDNNEGNDKGGSEDTQTSNENRPVVCCAIAPLNTSLTIPLSLSQVRITLSDYINILGFIPDTDYSIQTCRNGNCSSVHYVPLIRFLIVVTKEDRDTGRSTTKMMPGAERSGNGSESPGSGTVRPESGTERPGGGISVSNTIVTGGVIGGLAGLLFLSIAIVGVVLIIIVAKRRYRTSKSKDDDEDHFLTEGMIIDNVVYDEAGRTATTSLPYVEYSTMVYAEVNKGLRTSHQKDDHVYMVPAQDESSLYAQLKDIKTSNLSRDIIKIGDCLGSGQFGVVYKGVLESGEGEGRKVEVAVKTLREGAKEGERVKFLQEAAIMGQFKHLNVVTMYGVVTDGEPVLLVLELLTKGDLRSHLLRMRSQEEEEEEEEEVRIDDLTLLKYCRQVASGMAYLSSKAFVHRDLAARNILVSANDICKIADFGMSRDLMNESYYVSHGGKIPVKWTAPEALHYKKYSTASDVWSYGVLMYEIWSVGHKPFEGFENNRVIGMIGSGYRLAPPPGCPHAVYAIMIACWHPEASQRPKFHEVSRQLSQPDSQLLKWSEEDKAVHPEAAKLGADLLSAQDLYKDLQVKYEPNYM